MPQIHGSILLIDLRTVAKNCVTEIFNEGRVLESQGCCIDETHREIQLPRSEHLPQQRHRAYTVIAMSAECRSDKTRRCKYTEEVRPPDRMVMTAAESGLEFSKVQATPCQPLPG